MYNINMIIQLTIITKGKEKYIINNEVIEYEAGDIILIARNISHNTSLSAINDESESEAFQFPYDLFPININNVRCSIYGY